MTRETQLFVDAFTPRQRGPLNRTESRPASAVGQRVRWREDLTSDLLDASRGVGSLRGVPDALLVGHLEQVQGQERLNHNVGIRVLGKLTVIVCQRLLTRL